MKPRNRIFALVGLGLSAAVSACVAEESEVGAVDRNLPVATGATNLPLGASCVTGDEWQPDFSAYSFQEVNTESGGPQCASSICLVHHFEGRATCPYGQAAPSDPNQLDAPPCLLPDGRARVSVAVPPQLVHRAPEDTVTCSCRCDGPEGTGPFCACPAGFECRKLVDDLGLPPPGPYLLSGSYCIKAGTAYDPNMSTETCDWQTKNCGPG
jgi:hypothetical protein